MKATYLRFGRGESLNSLKAKNYGKFPLTGAAKDLGVSTSAFKAGISKADIIPCEWHHVGKFATAVDFFDTEECDNSYLFWIGAMQFYKTKTKKQLMFSYAKHAYHLNTLEQMSSNTGKFNRHNKSVYTRRREIADKYPELNLNIGGKWVKHLNGEPLRLFLLEKKKELFKKKIKANLQCKVTFNAPKVSKSTRFEVLKAKFGNSHFKAIRTFLKKNNLPLFEHNYKMAQKLILEKSV